VRGRGFGEARVVVKNKELDDAVRALYRAMFLKLKPARPSGSLPNQGSRLVNRQEGLS
jgi:hypothetical protein